MSKECNKIQIGWRTPNFQGFPAQQGQGSTRTSEFPAFGIYDRTEKDLNDHPVYKHQDGTQHMSFDTEYGWRVSFGQYT